MNCIHVLRAGFHTTLQDRGRYGYQKFGVVVGGAMDEYALRIANLLVRNDEDEAALEITLMGPTLQMTGDNWISICGGNLHPTMEGRSIPMWRPVWVKEGAVVKFRSATEGCRAYFAISGGFQVSKVLGSKSTYPQAKLGVFEGRPLKDGDVLPIRESMPERVQESGMIRSDANASFHATDWFVGGEFNPNELSSKPVRVVKGPQYDAFTPESQRSLFSSPFTVTPQSNRMGFRLTGPGLALQQPLEFLSEAVTAGTLQVPPGGDPILLMADRPSTGGYPKIAQVATVDIPRLAQVKPGEEIRFREITLSEAQSLYRRRESEIRTIQRGIELHG